MNKIIDEFCRLAYDASLHYADDTGAEWGLGNARKNEAVALYHAHPELQDVMRAEASRFLWSLERELGKGSKS